MSETGCDAAITALVARRVSCVPRFANGDTAKLEDSPAGRRRRDETTLLGRIGKKNHFRVRSYRRRLKNHGWGKLYLADFA